MHRWRRCAVPGSEGGVTNMRPGRPISIYSLTLEQAHMYIIVAVFVQAASLTASDVRPGAVAKRVLRA